MSTLTPEAKALLSKTIRDLRERLLRDLHDEAESRYRLSLPIEKAGLDEEHRRRRQRLDAFLDERVRQTKSTSKKDLDAARERFRRTAEKEAAATLVNRIVLLRHLEAMSLSRPEVVTGGWTSKGYRAFREFAPELVNDETEGYAALLDLLFDELALDLPGLFGDVGLSRLFSVPAATLREVVERLDDPALASAWTDDTTLGWTYQFWNDPEREALDAKINDGGKVEPHEIAAKTQMFTERYMVEWLLHNSLGLKWLCISKKNGWTAEAEAVLPVLNARRAAWREKRETGEVALDALMPIEAGLEDCWKYYVPQPIPTDAVESAPDSIRAVKLLDPACGSGHFLVIAFDLLAALYREEARHRGDSMSDREIAESILENNLFGVDIDPRAIQIAAAGLFLKAKAFARDARPKQINLVAPALNLARLPEDDPALVQLRREIGEATGIPGELTSRLIESLKGVDHLGSLLKVDAAIDDALRAHERPSEPPQGDLFGGMPDPKDAATRRKKRETVLTKLERFLGEHASEEDLGLRLDGEQLAAGIRFMRIVREDTYDVVCGNPPYQGTSRMADAEYVAAKYPLGKADLCTAFLERGLELVRPGGVSALLTMRGWMFLGQWQALRERLLHVFDLRCLGDLDKGAFESMTTSQLISVSMSTFLRAAPAGELSVSLQPTAPGEKYWGRDRTELKRAAILAQVGRFSFDTHGFAAIEGEPIVYWWTEDFLTRYANAPKLGKRYPALNGLSTQNNVRFVRTPWEVRLGDVWISRDPSEPLPDCGRWFPYIKGGAGAEWFEAVSWVVPWGDAATPLRVFLDEYQRVRPGGFIKHEDYYFRLGVAFTVIGSSFAARAHRARSIFGHMGSSVFPEHPAELLCLLNSKSSRFVLESLNPSVHFLATDVDRLPVFPVADADRIWTTLEGACTAHERARESSVEYRRPTASPWIYAQDWAQRAVDRPEGAPLPPYEPVYDQPTPPSLVSFAIGIALGRLGASGEGILDEVPLAALPHGILFLSAATERDSLDHTACEHLRTAWKEYGAVVGEGDDLRTYLRKSLLAHHRSVYENRPIYFPLSSAKKSFVAWVSIHRWRDDTLSILLADHLLPERRALEGQLDDLRHAKAEGDKKGRGKAEDRFAKFQTLLGELNAFIEAVTECADKGPPPSDDKCPVREVDARYSMDLDDGVMVNSSALWPLLEPQWKDPKKWWKELATAQGRKDYDWSHLAARYFPKRALAKCVDDPSLAVAHGCFWRLHPAKAYQWELRLQDEIRPDFTIDEPDSDAVRAKFLAEHAREAAEIEKAEQTRRERKAKKAVESADGPLFEREEEEDESLPEAADA